jgi:hypothetical protein
MRRAQEQIITNRKIEPVLTGVEVLKLKALFERVVVLHTVYQIVVKIEMAETVGHEGVIEPVEAISGKVQVAQVHLSREQSVDVLDLILGQVELG